MLGSHTKIFPLCHDFSFISARGRKDRIGQKCFSPLAAEKVLDTPTSRGCPYSLTKPGMYTEYPYLHWDRWQMHLMEPEKLPSASPFQPGDAELKCGTLTRGSRKPSHSFLPLEQTHTHFLNQNTIRNLTHDFSRLVILPICEMVYTVTKFKQHVLCFQ